MNEEKSIPDYQVDVSHLVCYTASVQTSSMSNVSVGMAKKLSRVGEAAPVVAASISGTDKEQNISSRYGGTADGGSLTVMNPDMSLRSFMQQVRLWMNYMHLLVLS